MLSDFFLQKQKYRLNQKAVPAITNKITFMHAFDLQQGAQVASGNGSTSHAD